MIDLTPLDVRNKRGDFKKILRGYDPQEVDVFLELVAERLEAVVRENIQLRERSETLQQQVSSQSGRERAVQEALVTAQELRSDIRVQAQREAELILAEARASVRDLQGETEHKIHVQEEALAELQRHRMRFLRSFRQLLERELDVVEVEEGRQPLDERPIELELSGGKPAAADEDAADGTSGDLAVPSPEPLEDERPSLDASVNELAAAHEEDRSTPDEPTAEDGQMKSARELVLPLQEDPTEPGADPRWG